MIQVSDDQLEQSLTVRSYQPSDQQAVVRLFDKGLLEGVIAPNDTGADIDNVVDAYFSDEFGHLWVAQVDGQVLGMIAVAREAEHTAEIRRLRVEPAWQCTGIGAKLLETAIAHCQHHGCLKIVFNTRINADTALDLFDRFGFQHTRTRETEQKDLLEFYLDLYRQPRAEDD